MRIFSADSSTRTNPIFKSLQSACSSLARLSLLIALQFIASSILFGGLGAAYTLKRALSIDIFPGLDMLPDEEIERFISAVLSQLGF